VERGIILRGNDFFFHPSKARHKGARLSITLRPGALLFIYLQPPVFQRVFFPHEEAVY
jgi:hypothetical protein